MSNLVYITAEYYLFDLWYQKLDFVTKIFHWFSEIIKNSGIIKSAGSAYVFRKVSQYIFCDVIIIISQILFTLFIILFILFFLW